MPEESISSLSAISIGVPELPRILRNDQRWRREIANINSPIPQVNKKFEKNDKGVALRVKSVPTISGMSGIDYKPKFSGRNFKQQTYINEKSSKPDVYYSDEEPESTNVRDNKPKIIRRQGIIQ